MLQHCIDLNNAAVQQFESGDFRLAARICNDTLVALKLALLSPASFSSPFLGDVEYNPPGSFDRSLTHPSTTEMAHPGAYYYSYSRPTRRWTQSVRVQAQEEDDVFVFSRALYLSPSSSNVSDVLDYYATIILYNFALCYHMLARSSSKSTINDNYYSERAYRLYSMSFQAMRLAKYNTDTVLVAVIFNNCGHLLCRERRLPEGVKCFHVVKDLLTGVTSCCLRELTTGDFSGMYLNTLMDSNTAPVA